MRKFQFTQKIERATAADGKEWIHLLPAGQFSAADGRGPFELAAETVLASFNPAHPLPVDINHAIDWQSGMGGESPAYGWINALESRETGIWGQVDWNDAGKQMLAAKSYRYISPVFMAPTDTNGIARVCCLLRASMCNNPALPQLTGLFTHNGDNAMNKELLAALGLPEDAAPAQAVEAAKALKTAQTAHEALSKELCAFAGTADEKQLMSALNAKLAAAEAGKSNLEKVVSELNAKMTAQEQAAKKEKAEAFVKQAMSAGKIVPALKDHYVCRHIADSAAVEKEVAAFVSVNAGSVDRPPENGGSLDAAEKEMCAALGLDEKAFLATKQEKK